MLRLIIFFWILSFFSFAQPDWISKTPPGYLNDYFVGKGRSKVSKTEAAQTAFEDAIISIIRNNSIEVSYSQKDNITSRQISKGDDIDLEVVRQSAQELQITGESKRIRGLKEVETYYETENGFYVSWVLVTLPKKNPIFPPTAFSPVWRSTLLPGWGQLYKGETFKGLAFLTLTIGGVASGLVFDQLSKDAAANAIAARTQARRDFFNEEKKNYHTYSIIGFIGAGVFYAWSLVDAIIVKNENLYVNLNDSDNNLRLQITWCF